MAMRLGLALALAFQRFLIQPVTSNILDDNGKILNLFALKGLTLSMHFDTMLSEG